MSKVSFVIPCYRSSKTIGGVVNEIESTMAQLAYEYEIILVNDSSPDDTFAVISALAEADGAHHWPSTSRRTSASMRH